MLKYEAVYALCQPLHICFSKLVRNCHIKLLKEILSGIKKYTVKL